MNHHPLTDDLRMYYSGTYIFRDNKGVTECMYVEGTERVGDDTLLTGVNFLGQGYNKDGALGWAVWPASDMIQYRPVSGYYDITGKGPRDRYIAFVVNNRSQRKGVDIRNITVNGAAANGFDGPRLCRVFEQSQDMCSNPGHRDLFIKKDGNVMWKGFHVGVLKDGDFTPREEYKQVEGLVCRLLQSI